ncbi:hypothetical protein O6H91_17G077100 [Diphasiastrum complanatum]|uniref:Uncharacterized protein n=1 Tax=Diphasiastrum complanatum TaxID=34168 RepID=A0ACC2B8F9_DIPCM|nr:hypothetical protein O6H91_17G077100 [Diphasiastrum complanatum]
MELVHPDKWPPNLERQLHIVIMFPRANSGSGLWISPSAQISRSDSMKLLEEPLWRQITPNLTLEEGEHHVPNEIIPEVIPNSFSQRLTQDQWYMAAASQNSNFYGVKEPLHPFQITSVVEELEEKQVPSDLMILEAPQLHSLFTHSLAASRFEKRPTDLYPCFMEGDNAFSDAQHAMEADACTSQALAGGHAIAAGGIRNRYEGVLSKLSPDAQVAVLEVVPRGLIGTFSSANGGFQSFSESVFRMKPDAQRGNLERSSSDAADATKFVAASQMEGTRHGAVEGFGLNRTTVSEFFVKTLHKLSAGIHGDSSADLQIDSCHSLKYRNLLLEPLSESIVENSSSFKPRTPSSRKRSTMKAFSPIGSRQPGLRRHSSLKRSASDAFAPAFASPGDSCLDISEELNSNMADLRKASFPDVGESIKHAHSSGSDGMLDFAVDRSEDEPDQVLRDEQDLDGNSDDLGVLYELDDKAESNSRGSEKIKGRKGLPAKNLMAERRRRKKLNDRLYMLRSVVPRITKMDRASILGDAIEYVKELLQRINDLHAELEAPLDLPVPADPLRAMGPADADSAFCATDERLTLPLQDQAPPAKVEVKLEAGKVMNIHMFCARRPGLLLSTMKALDGLGLDVQQAVISCFNGFALDVFRAEQTEASVICAEEIKAVLLHTASCQDQSLQQ